MTSRAMRLPSLLADDLCMHGDAIESHSRGLPPEILDAAFLAKDAAAAVVLVNASRRAYRRMRGWFRSFVDEGGSVSIHLRSGVVVDISKSTTDPELEEVLRSAFGEGFEDGSNGPLA